MSYGAADHQRTLSANPVLKRIGNIISKECHPPRATTDNIRLASFSGISEQWLTKE
jgi:hypothetical protein